MSIRRRTLSLVQPGPTHQEARSPSQPQQPSIDLNDIRRANWTSWRALLRVASIVLSLAAIGCMGWVATHSFHGPQHDHHVYDGVDVPWVLIPLSLLSFYNILCLLLTHFSHFRSLHPYATLPLDLIISITLGFINLFSTAGAVQALQWRAGQYYDDARSGHDGYYIYNPNRRKPGEPRLLKVPPRNATVCSGWDGDCDAQHAFENKTRARARVGLGGVSSKKQSGKNGDPGKSGGWTSDAANA
ncbi:MAG: hypothetical protein Q9169_003002 [Polycauliona sp. 2 TL-2023]